MKNNHIIRLGILLAGVAVASGCHNSDSDEPTANDTVPNNAGATSASFVAYIKGLPAGDETSEPLKINSDFVAPAEDQDEPIAL